MQNQDQKKATRRLDVLDGLRGVAMLMVFLNHVDSAFIVQAFPANLQQFVSFFFLSGKLGISFFFILSGFLMAYLYANPQPKEFIERRYARIFPPFISMVLCMSIFKLYPSLSLFPRVVIMLSTAGILRLLWVHVVERYHLGSLSIRLFLFLQLTVALWYGFFIMRQPPIWFTSLPFFIRQGTVVATNATLTLPLGDYIPMLDGVYWSLIPEMIFYLLYPFIFAPTVQKLKTKSLPFIFTFIVALFPFFFGTSLLFKHVRNFGMLFIEYFIYFCVGIGVATFARKKDIISLPPSLKKLFNPIVIFLLLLIVHLNLTNTQGSANLISRLLWSIPFGLIVYGLLDEKTPLAQFFSKKVFVFLGTISYAMYISHTAIVDGMHLVFRPTNVITNIIFLLLTTIVFLFVSYGIHLIIETPYFMFKPKKSEYVPRSFGRLPLLLLVIFFIITIFSAYSSKYNFFSNIQNFYDNQTEFNMPRADIIEITEKPLAISFEAQDNNLGVILIHLTNKAGSTQKNKRPVSPFISQKLLVHVKEKKGGAIIATQETSPAEIGESASYPVGIPVILNSFSKQYVLELVMKDLDYRSTLFLHTKPYVLQTVSQINKKDILLHPYQFLRLLIGKVDSLWRNNEALLVVLCVAPLFILLFLLLISP